MFKKDFTLKKREINDAIVELYKDLETEDVKHLVKYLEAEEVWRERVARIEANLELLHPTVLTIASELILRSLEIYIKKRDEVM